MPLGRLRHVLGGRPSLMAVAYDPDDPNKNGKERKRKWKSSNSDTYLAQNNIAVVQGHVTRGMQCGGAYSVDFDGNESISGEALAAKFFEMNPAAAWSFRTAGARGCNVHFIADASCPLPNFAYLFDSNGKEVGELRTGGCYTLVQGTHPSGCDYRAVVDAPAFNINPDQLKWIDNRNLIEHCQYRKASKRRERERERQHKQQPLSLICTQDNAQTYRGGIGEEDAERIAREILLKHLPTARGQSDKLHWDIAGALLSIGFKFTSPQLLNFGREWYDLSKDNIDPNKTREAHAADFHRRFIARRFPDGCGDGTFTSALEAAREEDAPDLIVDCFPHSKDIQFAATLCRELARLTANGVFFLSARGLQEVLQKKSAMSAHGIIRKLIDVGLIAIHRMHPRGSNKATEYKYLAADVEPLLEVVAATTEVAA